MTWVIDAIALIGGIVLAAGVFVQYGAGFSLIVGGVFLIAFALKAAKAQEEGNVSNDN